MKINIVSIILVFFISFFNGNCFKILSQNRNNASSRQPLRQIDLLSIEDAIDVLSPQLITALKEKNYYSIDYPSFKNKSPENINAHIAVQHLVYNLMKNGISVNQWNSDESRGFYYLYKKIPTRYHLNLKVYVKDLHLKIFCGYSFPCKDTKNRCLDLHINAVRGRDIRTIWTDKCGIKKSANTSANASWRINEYRRHGYALVEEFDDNVRVNAAARAAKSLNGFLQNSKKNNRAYMIIEKVNNFTSDDFEQGIIQASLTENIQTNERVSFIKKDKWDETVKKINAGEIKYRSYLPNYHIFGNIASMPYVEGDNRYEPIVITFYLWDIENHKIVWIDQNRLLHVKRLSNASPGQSDRRQAYPPFKQINNIVIEKAIDSLIPKLVDNLKQNRIYSVVAPSFSNRSSLGIDKQDAVSYAISNLVKSGIKVRFLNEDYNSIIDLEKKFPDRYNSKLKNYVEDYRIEGIIRDNFFSYDVNVHEIITGFKVLQSRGFLPILEDEVAITIDKKSDRTVPQLIEEYERRGYQRVNDFTDVILSKSSAGLAKSLNSILAKGKSGKKTFIVIKRLRNFTSEHLDQEAIGNSFRDSITTDKTVSLIDEVEWNNTAKEIIDGKKPPLPFLPNYILNGNVSGMEFVQDENYFKSRIITFYLYNIEKSEIVWIDQSKLIFVQKFTGKGF